MKTLTFIIAAAAIGGVAYYLGKKNNTKRFWTSNVKTIDGTLDFEDVVGYFKSKELDKGRDVPFIAKDGAFKQFLKKTHKRFPEGKDGYITIVIGVYDESTDTIKHAQILYVKQLDDKTKEVFGNEELVVLS